MATTCVKEGTVEDFESSRRTGSTKDPREDPKVMKEFVQKKAEQMLKMKPFADDPKTAKLLEDIRAGKHTPLFAGKDGFVVRTRREAVGNSLRAEDVNSDGAGCPQAEENVTDNPEYDDMYDINKD